MADEKDRLGDKLHQAGRAREDQWARLLDAEIIERLRRKYAKPIHCPQCDKNLDARVAIGLGGMACPNDHGAWADDETLRRLVARLKNVAAIRPDSAAEKPYIRVDELADELRQQAYRGDLLLPIAALRLEAEAAVFSGCGRVERDGLSKATRRVDRP